ncbi:outer membrane autotransporter protein [Litorivivens lipolytica]|uniref:Outer membrane autotransporter protein n=1 Tax=Litorivivens lipolytica TaxID=1524264 RepID=A0A7W4W5K4_9GAMM|nr:autotransporter outer membrane beta-barrel domain-containing protein [Litorivivens lipolytica]MBB3047845.1 outer membrane autotransporter protein [Litorivivens lipolytica]
MFWGRKITAVTGQTLLGATLLTSTNAALAANPAFENFYQQACTSAPSGSQFEARCNTEAANLSGDSESSLTPSHMLSAGDAALLSEEAEKNALSSQLAKIGPLSISAQAGFGEIESDNRDGTNGERGYTTDTEQLAITFDYRHSETLVSGLIFSVQRSELEFDALAPQGAFPALTRAGRYESDALGLTGFVSFSAKNGVFVDGALGYSDIDHDFERNSVFQPGSRTSHIRVNTSADVGGDLQTLHLRTGRYYNHGRATFSPQVSWQYSRTETDSYREDDDNNSGLAMRYESFTQTSSLFSAGGDFHFPVSTDWGLLSLQASLHYFREFDREDESIKAGFVSDTSGSTFEIEGEEPDQSYFQGGVGAILQFSHGWSAYLTYNQLFGHSEYDQYQSALGVRKEL